MFGISNCYFINEEYESLIEVEQIDKCLTYTELCELFLAKYDEKLNKEERNRILQKLSNRIKHVENCHECLSWCEYGSSLYNNICCDAIDFPNEKYFKYFYDNYQDYFKKKLDREKICKELGHDFDSWIYHEWRAETDSIFDREAIKSGKYIHQECTRTCKRCGYIDKKEPVIFESKESLRILKK